LFEVPVDGAGTGMPGVEWDAGLELDDGVPTGGLASFVVGLGVARLPDKEAGRGDDSTCAPGRRVGTLRPDS
jgi:hypothetical protein